MKNTSVFILICLTATLLFTGCGYNVFPEKSTYTVTQNTSSPASLPASSNPSLVAEAFKDRIIFFLDQKEWAVFQVVKPHPCPDRVPCPPRPCEPVNLCNKIKLSIKSKNPMLVFESQGYSLDLKLESAGTAYKNFIDKSPNTEFLLTMK